MARMATGHGVLEQAKVCIAEARTVAELRQAQSVVFPIELGLSLDQTAAMLGISKEWVCRLRTSFIRNGGVCSGSGRHGGRRRQNMTSQEETAFLSPFMNQARTGGVLVVSEIKVALEKYLGRRVALSSVYNLLHRSGWRKIVPDKHHVKSDTAAQETWKKNSRRSSRK